MSYLHRPRLYFSGRFQADPSTVNNDPKHFNNATFQPNFQQPGPGATNGWWNPEGTGSFRFFDCSVTAVDFDGPAADPIVGMTICGSDDRVSGKIVDLDPLQQGVSEVWGMQVRLVNSALENLLLGDYTVAAFTDMWGRAAGAGGGDTSAAAYWQSVLENVQWGDLPASPFLAALRAATSAGRLSIKFNVDGYNMDRHSPDFTTGRVTGVIGPYLEGEPLRFTPGRHLLPVGGTQAFNFAPCIVDTAAGKLVADLGNSIQTTTPGGPMNPSGPLSIGIDTGAAEPVSLGAIAYTDPDWYNKRAGVQEFPAGCQLTSAELAALASKPVVVYQPANASSGTGPVPLLEENPGGLYVRADCFVFRLNAGQEDQVDLYASAYGKPLPNAEVVLGFTTGLLDNSSFTVNAPARALSFPGSVTTGADGRATFKLSASNPGTPRNYLDGQVYGVGYGLRAANTGTATPNPNDFISVQVYTEMPVPDHPTWWGNIQQVLRQYQNLYPRMGSIVKLGDYDSVIAHLPGLESVFSKDIHDPNYMPATRDLSASKLAMILKWMKSPGADGKPLLGVKPS